MQNRTEHRKYHFIYKTTCSVNGKYYYGMHSTDILDDGYIGSGSRLSLSIKKHGRENFKLEILEFCTDRETLKKREAELITEEKLHDPMCMNLKLGGEGGFTVEASHKGGISVALKMNEEQRIARAKKARANSPAKWDKNAIEKSKTNEAISKRKSTFASMSHQQGVNNSQFGTIWITNGITNKKISKHAEIPDGFRKGRTIGS